MNTFTKLTMLFTFISCGAVDNIFYDSNLVGDKGVLIRTGVTVDQLELDTVYPVDGKSYGANLLIEGRCGGTAKVQVSSLYIAGKSVDLDCTDFEFSQRVALSMPTNSDTPVDLTIEVSKDTKTITNTRSVIVNATPPQDILTLEAAAKTKTSMELVWTQAKTSARPIENYILQIRSEGVSEWKIIDKALSTDTRYTVEGLNPNSLYEFRVIADNGNLSNSSDELVASTMPEHSFYDNDKTSLINIGGATSSSVVSFEDGNQITLNGNVIATLNAGQTLTFSSALFDVLSGTGKIHAAGGLIKQATASKQGQMVWANKDSTGKSFVISTSRFQGHVVNVYAFEDTSIELKKGTVSIQTLTLVKDQSISLNLSTNAQYSIESTGVIAALSYSEGSGSKYVVDPYLMQACSKRIIGFPSRSGQFVSDKVAQASIIHSDDFEQSITINPGTRTNITSRGSEISLYKGLAAVSTSDNPVCARSNADSTGYGSSSFLPVSKMRTTHAVETDAKWVAFTSLSAGTIDLVDQAGNTVQTLILSRSGVNELAPYTARVENVPAGTILKASVRVAAWYETKGLDGSSKDDETILMGYDL